MPKLSALLTLLLAAGLIAAGCGDDDDDGGEETTIEETTIEETGATGTTGATGEGGEEPLDSEAIKDEINSICLDAEKEAAAVAENLPQGGSESDQIDAAVEEVVPVLEDTVDQMKAVPGAEDDAEVGEYIETLDREIQSLKDDPQQLLEADPFGEADRIASEIGLDDCANDSVG